MGLVGSLIGGIFGSNASSKAANQQVTAANQAGQLATTAATNAQTGVGNATQSGIQAIQAALQNYAPFINAGGPATQSLQQLAQSGPASTAFSYGQGNTPSSVSAPFMDQIQQITNGQLGQQFSFAPTDLQNDPGYQFTLGQGQQAIQRSAAAQGNVFSGGTQKSLANYTTGTANQYFNDAYNRALSTFGTNRQGALSQITSLQGLAGLANTGFQQGLATQQQNVNQQQVTSNTLQSLAQLALSGSGNALQGSEAISNTGLQGANLAGNFGLTGAGMAGQYLTNAGNAAAAGTVGSTNAWLQALQNGSNQLNAFVALNSLPQSFFGGGSTSAGLGVT